MQLTISARNKDGKTWFDYKDSAGGAFCVGEFDYVNVHYYAIVTAKHLINSQNNLFNSASRIFSNFQYPQKIAVMVVQKDKQQRGLLSIDYIVSHETLDLALLFLGKRHDECLMETYSVDTKNYDQVEVLVKGLDNIVFGNDSINFVHSQKLMKVIDSRDSNLFLDGKVSGGWSGSPVLISKSNKVIGLVSRATIASVQEEQTIVQIFPSDFEAWLKENREKFEKSLVQIKIEGNDESVNKIAGVIFPQDFKIEVPNELYDVCFETGMPHEWKRLEFLESKDTYDTGRECINCGYYKDW